MSKTSADPLKKQKDFEDFFRLPNFLLSNFNWDFPSKPRSKRSMMLRNCYFCLAAISHLYVIAFIAKATINMWTSSDYELSQLLRFISAFNYGFFAILKCLAFGWNIKQNRKIFETLKEIYPKTRQEKLSFQVQNYFWPKWILFVIYFYLGATTFIVTSPPLESIFLYVVSVVKVGRIQTKFGYHKLYEIEYSFDHQTFSRYCITYAIELLHAHFSVIFNMCSDIWLLCFTLLLCMHFENIAHRLENYEPDKKTFLKDQEFIAQVVKRHQLILNLSEDINKSFGLSLFWGLFSIAVTLCCLGIHCFTQGLDKELVELAAFIPTIIGRYFLVCYYGQLLIIKSQKVAETAYNNPWYNGSPSYKKSIFIILMRAQKVAELNALGLQPICLEAFKMVMGATYRVFALLKETMF